MKIKYNLNLSPKLKNSRRKYKYTGFSPPSFLTNVDFPQKLGFLLAGQGAVLLGGGGWVVKV